MQFAAHDDAAFGKADFFPNLGLQIPAGRNNGGGNKFGANVAF
jgi:hypothetical protein